jgi:antibiotic biosynthesis monooxygenase (ABM) superfamily enzyme
MNTSKSVLVFVSLYILQWATLTGIVTFASGIEFKAAMVMTPVGAFMILMGWIIPCIVALDYKEWADNKAYQARVDREWKRNNEEWKMIVNN